MNSAYLKTLSELKKVQSPSEACFQVAERFDTVGQAINSFGANENLQLEGEINNRLGHKPLMHNPFCKFIS